jgi:enoyl-CoA hydratase/carnithine racemase
VDHASNQEAEMSTKNGSPLQAPAALPPSSAARKVNLTAAPLDLAAQLAAVSDWSRSPDVYAVIVSAMAPAPPPGPVDLTALARLAWRYDCFPKPLVALLDHLVSPTALTLTTVATHRVAAPSYRFSVPALETADALPLGGIARALARLPHAIGTYLALTGEPIGRADALALGLVTHTVPYDAVPPISAGLTESQPVDPLLDGLQSDPGSPTLLGHAPAIARCFSQPTSEAILAALSQETGPHADWAQGAHNALSGRPGETHAVTLRFMRDAAALDVRGALILSHTVATHRAAYGASGDTQLFLKKNAALALPERSEIAIGRF